MQSIIENFKNRVENKFRFKESDLITLLAKLTTQKASAKQALDILNCCSYARLNENQTTVVENIWNELKNQNFNFQIQHYNCILSFARDKGNINLAEEIFNDIQKNGIKPNP